MDTTMDTQKDTVAFRVFPPTTTKNIEAWKSKTIPCKFLALLITGQVSILFSTKSFSSAKLTVWLRRRGS